MVDTETQTDQSSAMHMDMSETDASPSPFVASRELAMCLRDSGRGRSIEDLNAATTGNSVIQKASAAVAAIPVYTSSSSTRRRSSCAALRHASQTLPNVDIAKIMTASNGSMESPQHLYADAIGSPNGNSDELTYQDASSGSDRDPLDVEDVMNSNDERLDARTPIVDDVDAVLAVVVDDVDDDDNLERLGRRVSAFFTENRHSIQSATSSDNGNAIGAQTISTAEAVTQQQLQQKSFADGVTSTAAVTAGKVRRGFVSVSGDGSEVTVLRQTDDVCGTDSWTDEDGEDPDNQYLGLRRKRYIVHCGIGGICTRSLSIL